MGAKVVIKDNGLFMRLEFWNGAVLQRRFSGDGDFTIHYIRDDYTLELNSKGESKFIPKHYLPKSPEEIYEFNWLLGTLQTVDSSNTSFTINADGSFEVTKVPATDRPTSPSRTRGVQKDGTLVSALLRSEWSPDPTVPRNPPRLFVIDEDGSGVELLRDMDLIPYLRREINNPETTIVEEPWKMKMGL
ncbi:hypothetical protein BC829DRAFT_43618 [Chytridium lagenaria]|nr:hypothetical protein BC829DRAFT_43618 [Chytridium lagenaria]